jgi:hypothetical protein
MGAVTIGLLALGGVGILLLVISLLVGDIADLGGADASDLISLPAAATFVGAFGFAGALGSAFAGGSGTAAALAGGIAGIGGALPASWFAVRLTRALAGMHTDGTVTAAALVGVSGVVVTRIPAAGYGEVRVMIGGQPLKLNAKADTPLAAGAAVFVVEAPTESSVVVVETASLP